MAQLFLSYAREDREAAELLARALTSRGWTVWWDRDIPVGRKFHKVIEQELSQAKCVIVLWSHNAVASDWVQNEAADAAQREILVPVRIDDVRLPLEFRRLQTADLCDWRKGFQSSEFESCLASVEMLVRKTVPGPQPVPTPEPPPVIKQPKAKEDPAPVDDPTDDLWINQDGQRFRAPDLPTLRKWAEERRVRADSHVFDPAVQQWVLAREIPALKSVYQAQVPAPTPTPTPTPAPIYTPQPPAAKTRWPLIAVIGGIGLLVLLLVAALLGQRTSYDPNIDTTTLMTTTDPPVTDTSPKMPTPAQPITVSMTNRCTDRSISAAVHYLNIANQWITIGWYGLEPGETKQAVQAIGPAIYFYAKSYDETVHWYGDPKNPDTREVLIHPVLAFQAVNNELKMDGMVSVPFQTAVMDTNLPTYIYNFSCN